MSRTLGSYLTGNAAEPLVRLGRWDEADELTARALAALPEGVFSATLHGVRAELAAMRGRYDEAARELRETRRMVGDTRDVQFTLTLRSIAAMTALGRGDIAAARQAVTDGLPEAESEWGARYAWPLLWLGMRLEADDATRHRDRRDPVPGELAARCATLARVAAGLQVPSPSCAAYRELVAAERSRAAGWTPRRTGWRPRPRGKARMTLTRCPTASFGSPRRSPRRATWTRPAAPSGTATRSPAAGRRAGRRRGPCTRPPCPAGTAT